VDEGPQPPHEREWRHPSELGPPPHEPTTRSGRLLIASTATLGLLLVGILAITMTPRRSTSPVATSSTPLGIGPAPVASAGLLPLVTPIGRDGWAVTTADALTGKRGRMARVQLATGGIVVVEIVRTTDDVTVVALPDGVRVTSFDVSGERPSGDDTVVLHAEDEPVVVAMGELANADVAEATPVLDERGRMLGLATGEPDARWMVPVDTVPATTTTTSTSTTTTTTSSSVPDTTTTSAPTTAPAPSTTAGPVTTTTAPPTTPPTPPTTAPPPTTVTPTQPPIETTTPPTVPAPATPPSGGTAAIVGTG
jgi:hypothetical protein